MPLKGHEGEGLKDIALIHIKVDQNLKFCKGKLLYAQILTSHPKLDFQRLV